MWLSNDWIGFLKTYNFLSRQCLLTVKLNNLVDDSMNEILIIKHIKSQN